jgi:DNA integrity scanning protein DisA with diadenylate cyclase activity
MKVCLKENEFNPSFIVLYGEEKAKEQGYIIVEVDDRYLDCCFEDFENFVFSVEKYNARKEQEFAQLKSFEINKWFNWYDNQVKQYQRCVRLGIEFDKDIVELDNQAKAYQEELRQLKVEVSNGK